MSDLQLRHLIRQLKMDVLDTSLWHKLYAEAQRDEKEVWVAGQIGPSRQFAGILDGVGDSEVGGELYLRTNQGGGSIFANEVILESLQIRDRREDLCIGCQDPEHEICVGVSGCSCCENTRRCSLD